MEEPEPQLQNLNLSDSQQCMNELQLQIFLDVRRSRSNDSLIGDLLNEPVYEKRSLVFDFPVSVPDPQKKQKASVKTPIFKPKIKKVKVKKECDYRKNICGYITKKIIREYLGNTYKPFTLQLCEKHNCSYQASKTYYLDRIEKITGPSHISGLVTPMSKQQVTIKAAFKEFFIWFLKERYLRYLLLEGKMDQKKAYIDYKNNTLMSLIKSGDQTNQSSETSSYEIGDYQDSYLI